MIVEIALSLEDYGTASVRRKKQGDILEARPPSTGVGMGEMTRFVWGRVDVSEATAAILLDGTEVYKRRYYIPLNRLKQAWEAAGGPVVDVARLLDPTDAYQPCIPVDPLTGLWLPGQAIVLNGSGLIYDRTTGKAI
jgi:hypothetical protein